MIFVFFSCSLCCQGVYILSTSLEAVSLLQKGKAVWLSIRANGIESLTIFGVFLKAPVPEMKKKNVSTRNFSFCYILFTF